MSTHRDQECLVIFSQHTMAERAVQEQRYTCALELPWRTLTSALWHFETSRTHLLAPRVFFSLFLFPNARYLVHLDVLGCPPPPAAGGVERHDCAVCRAELLWFRRPYFTWPQRFALRSGHFTRCPPLTLERCRPLCFQGLYGARLQTFGICRNVAKYASISTSHWS